MITGRVSPTDIKAIEMKEKTGFENGSTSKSNDKDTGSKNGKDKEDQPTVGVFEVVSFDASFIIELK